VRTIGIDLGTKKPLLWFTYRRKDALRQARRLDVVRQRRSEEAFERAGCADSAVVVVVLVVGLLAWG
jgi:hypothetical protein